MRVAFGTTVLQRGLASESLDGIGNYTRELLKQLGQMRGLELKPFAFSGNRFSSSGHPILNLGPFKSQAILSAASGLSFPFADRSVAGEVDLVHATDHLIPSLGNVPVVATLMDAIPLAHPEWVPSSFRKIKNSLWRRSVHWARWVVTISAHARQELVKWFKLREDRISVIPLGVDRRWFVVPSNVDIERVNRHYGLPRCFFLFVGTLQPRKNILGLIAAHRMLPRAMRNDFPLLVIGRPGRGGLQTVRALAGNEDQTLRWLQYVPDTDLVPLVRRASAMVFPSFYEGFGLPILEAFAAGVPVVASNLSALPEVAGDAAWLVDPTRADALAEAMQSVVLEAATADELRRRGRARALQFTWEKTAAETAKVYHQVLASC
ncbi:MAG TPA: glycosyltransferase family 1 protein [Desulfobulbaceae bacterium]|nr:glycosyltransferase family 1 protein [Desulfobulbaceae bacterium]